MTRSAHLKLCTIVFLAGCPLMSVAGTMNLAWDAVPSADGYRVYYGTAPGNYAFSTDVGLATQTTLTGLSDCTNWYVAVKAYNNSGESPNYSNEVSGWGRPEVASATPAAEKQGSQFTLDIDGANFQAGAILEIDNPDVLLSSVAVLDCNRMQALATIEPTTPGVKAARIGRYTLTVTNPDQIYGARTNAFEVLVDRSRFDINTSTSATQGRLDGRDTISLSFDFGTQQGDPGYEPDTDFDGDGWIDGQDLAYLAGSLGTCWEPAQENWTIAACPVGLQ